MEVISEVEAETSSLPLLCIWSFPFPLVPFPVGTDPREPLKADLGGIRIVNRTRGGSGAGDADTDERHPLRDPPRLDLEPPQPLTALTALGVGDP